MPKLNGKELEAIFAEEFTTRVGTGETTVKGEREVAVRKLYRVHPNNFHPDVVRFCIQEGLSRMHGRFLNDVAVEKGMKQAAWERMLEELQAGEFPEAMVAKRKGSSALSSEDAMIAHLAKQDLIAIVSRSVKGTGKGGRVLASDVLSALDGSKNFGDLVRAAGDGLAWDDAQVVEWATETDDSGKHLRKRDYAADAKAELERQEELREVTADDIDIDDLMGEI